MHCSQNGWPPSGFCGRFFCPLVFGKIMFCCANICSTKYDTSSVLSDPHLPTENWKCTYFNNVLTHSHYLLRGCSYSSAITTCLASIKKLLKFWKCSLGYISATYKCWRFYICAADSSFILSSLNRDWKLPKNKVCNYKYLSSIFFFLVKKKNKEIKKILSLLEKIRFA